MFVPAVLCFVLWTAFGYLETKRFARLKAWVLAVPRGLRAFWGAGLMLGGALFFFGALMGIALSQRGPEVNLGPGPWAIIAFGGIVFAKAQMMGALLLFSLAQAKPRVTTDRADTSESS